MKRILGRTGWNISAIGFGAIKLPQINQKECDVLLNQAIDLGINFVDEDRLTSDLIPSAYRKGVGWNEKRCGLLWPDLNNRPIGH